MSAQPKPVKRSTLKSRKTKVKSTNIAAVREQVEQRDGETCRITATLRRFGFLHQTIWGRLELAHMDARGMGGNPDLSRDTPENTILIIAGLHQGSRSHHSGHLKIGPLTDQGANGPCCFEFYEQLPTEVRRDPPQADGEKKD